jgi:hypothetical protein
MTRSEFVKLRLSLNANTQRAANTRDDLRDIAELMRELDAPLLPRMLVAVLSGTMRAVDFAWRTLARMFPEESAP